MTIRFSGFIIALLLYTNSALGLFSKTVRTSPQTHSSLFKTAAQFCERHPYITLGGALVLSGAACYQLFFDKQANHPNSTQTKNKNGTTAPCPQAEHNKINSEKKKPTTENPQNIAVKKLSASQPPKSSDTKPAAHISQQAPKSSDTKPAAHMSQQDGKTYALPKSLGEAHIVHLESLNQMETTGHGTACGNYALYNLAAIHQLVSQGEPINSENVKDKVRIFIKDLGVGRMLDALDIYNLAPQANIPQLAIVEYNAEAGNVLSYYYRMQDVTPNQQPMTPYNADENTIFINDETAVSYFICNTGGHWVAAAIIKKHGNQPKIIYLNSTNAPAVENTPAEIFLQQVAAHALNKGELIWLNRPSRKTCCLL